MPRKPTEVLQLNGAFEKNPKRKRAVGPKSSTPIGQAPEYLSDTEKAIWFEVTTYAPRGVLTGADRYILETVAQLVAKLRARTLTATALNQLIRCLSLLGFTPSDRSRVTSVGEAEEKDPFAKFLN